jgi:hypothetical protein
LATGPAKVYGNFTGAERAADPARANQARNVHKVGVGDDWVAVDDCAGVRRRAISRPPLGCTVSSFLHPSGRVAIARQHPVDGVRILHGKEWKSRQIKEQFMEIHAILNADTIWWR